MSLLQSPAALPVKWTLVPCEQSPTATSVPCERPELRDSSTRAIRRDSVRRDQMKAIHRPTARRAALVRREILVTDPRDRRG